MRAQLVEVGAGGQMEDAVAALAELVVDRMDPGTFDEIMENSASFLCPGAGPDAAVAAVGRFLTATAGGATFVKDLTDEFHRAIDLNLAACLAVSLGGRISEELDSDSEPPGRALTLAPRTVTNPPEAG